VELKTELWRDARPIGEAVMGNHVHTVECLLSEVGSEVDLQSADSRGENLLDIAAEHGTGNSTT
jgi:ankyrin repeat protein